MRVFLFLIVAAKNSKKRRAAWSPASAITRGTTTPSRDGDDHGLGLDDDDGLAHAG